MKLEYPRQIFKRYSNIKFNENPFSGSRVVAYERTDRTKLTVIFRYFSKARKTTSNTRTRISHSLRIYIRNIF